MCEGDFPICKSFFNPLIVVSEIAPMAGSGCSMNSSQANVPLFKGDNYNRWSLKMKTHFKSRDLWGLVEKGFNDDDDGNQYNKNEKKDVKALYLI